MKISNQFFSKLVKGAIGVAFLGMLAGCMYSNQQYPYGTTYGSYGYAYPPEYTSACGSCPYAGGCGYYGWYGYNKPGYCITSQPNYRGTKYCPQQTAPAYQY